MTATALLSLGLLLGVLLTPAAQTPPPPEDAGTGVPLSELLEQGDVFTQLQSGTPEASILLEVPAEGSGTDVYQLRPETGEILARYSVEGVPLSDGTLRAPRLQYLGDGFLCGNHTFFLKDGVLTRLPTAASLEADRILDLAADDAGGVYLLAATDSDNLAAVPPVGSEVLYLDADGAMHTALSRQYGLGMTDLTWDAGQLHLRYEAYSGRQTAAWATSRAYLLERPGDAPAVRVTGMGFPDDIYWSFPSDEEFRAYVQSQVDAEQQRLNNLGIGIAPPAPEIPEDARVLCRHREGADDESVVYQWTADSATEIRQIERRSGRVLASYTVPFWQQPNLSDPFARTIDHVSDAGCWGAAGLYRFQDGRLTCVTGRPVVNVLPLDDGGAYLLSYTDDYVPAAVYTAESGLYGNEVLHLWPDGSVTTALSGVFQLEFSDLRLHEGTLQLVYSFGREIDPCVKTYLLEQEGQQPRIRVHSIRATDNEYAAHLDDPEGFQAALQAEEEQRLRALGIEIVP